ncbi:MAG: hypothetical protein NUV88_01445 [Candidatus Kaiserbacteria bacterium]|nr:hypothetical protein [Candidatus Kaiserbacteria bacterium]
MKPNKGVSVEGMRVLARKAYLNCEAAERVMLKLFITIVTTAIFAVTIALAVKFDKNRVLLTGLGGLAFISFPMAIWTARARTRARLKFAAKNPGLKHYIP